MIKAVRQGTRTRDVMSSYDTQTFVLELSVHYMQLSIKLHPKPKLSKITLTLMSTHMRAYKGFMWVQESDASPPPTHTPVGYMCECRYMVPGVMCVVGKS